MTVALLALALLGAPPPDLLRNGGFEEPGLAGWACDGAVYARDDSVAHTGKASLRHTNNDAGRYRLCSQKVPVRPGRQYRFSAWIRTRDLTGNDSGATICLEWLDKAGRWLGGAYPAGIKGTRDWTLVEDIVRLPAEAADCTLNGYVRKGMTGTAWFDDVELVQVRDPLLQTVLLAPVYRGRITPEGPREVRVRARLNLEDHDLRPADFMIHAEIDNPAKGRSLGRATARSRGEGPCDLAIPAADLPEGKYSLTVRLAGPDGKDLAVSTHPIREVASYLRTFDVIGTDPYPISRRPASEAAAWTVETFRQVEGARPLWQVPQAHHWGNYRKEDRKTGRTPTYAEKRSMA